MLRTKPDETRPSIACHVVSKDMVGGHQHNTNKNVQRNAEKVHDGAPGFFRNVLGPHLHNGWPEYANTTFKSTEVEKLNAPDD
ncbi:hypothetical protein RYX36_002882 [Vicia faba]